MDTDETDTTDTFTLSSSLNESETISLVDIEPVKTVASFHSPEIDKSKWNEVNSWLKISFDIADAQFEYNEMVLSVLRNIMLFNKQRNNDVAEVIASFNLKKNEYEKESKRYATLIKRLGIEAEHLDSDFQTWLDTLAQINLILDLKSPRNADFLLAVNQLQDSILKTEYEIASEMKLVSFYQKKTQNAMQKAYELQQILTLSKQNHAILESDVLKQTKKIGFLPKKIEEYEQKLQKLKLKLEETGYKPELLHQTLMKRNNEVIKITNEIKASQVTLDTFSNLPPDLGVIKQKIEDVRKELCKVDAALKAKITNLNY